jgi:hypothetical protein
MSEFPPLNTSPPYHSSSGALEELGGGNIMPQPGSWGGITATPRSRMLSQNAAECCLFVLSALRVEQDGKFVLKG